MLSRPSLTLSVLLAAALFGVTWVAFFVSQPGHLFEWTGEEQSVPQMVALWNLAVGQLRAMPETDPFMPVAHTGMKPFGVNTFLEQEVEPAKRERICQMIHEAGFAWIRQEFPWQDIEIHSKGDFEDRRNEPHRSAWEKYDHIVELAEKYNLKIIARLSSPPDWSRAAGSKKGPFAPPDHFSDFGDFVRAVATRYKGRIHYYQIWNEPNIYPEWGEQPVDPVGYTALLKVGYENVKAVDPDAVVICGALAATIEMDGYPHGLNDFIFLQRMYDAGAKDYFDVMSVQGYGLWSAPTDRRMRPRVLNFARPQYIRDIMIKNGDGHKPIWMSEMNWNAIPADHPAYPTFGRVTEAQQAEYARLAYQRAQEEWPWMGVINVWFFKRATDAERSQPMYYFRMVEPDFRPLPIYDALKTEAHQPPVMYPGYHHEDHWAVQYSGPWQEVRDPQATLGRYRLTQGQEAGARFTFSGTDLDLLLRPLPDGGILRVSCDGQPEIALNASGKTGAPGRRVAACHRLLDGRHEVELRVADPGGMSPRPVGIEGYLVQRSVWSRVRPTIGIVIMLLGATALGALLARTTWQVQG